MSNLEQPEAPREDEFLTQEERFQLKRLLSKPEEFPRELGAWITDYMGTNGFFQKSQVQGLPLLNTQVQQALEDLDALVEELDALAVRSGDTLPSNPDHGELFVLTVADGLAWNFRYNAGSASSFKWEFTGGPPLQAYSAGAVATASSSYTDLGGPAVTIPLAGDYMVTISCTMGSSGADNMVMSFTVGGSAASDSDALGHIESSSGNVFGSSRVVQKTGLAAATVLSTRYRNRSNVNFSSFSNRFISVEPIRVA